MNFKEGNSEVSCEWYRFVEILILYLKLKSDNLFFELFFR